MFFIVFSQKFSIRFFGYNCTLENLQQAKAAYFPLIDYASKFVKILPAKLQTTVLYFENWEIAFIILKLQREGPIEGGPIPFVT